MMEKQLMAGLLVITVDHQKQSTQHFLDIGTLLSAIHTEAVLFYKIMPTQRLQIAHTQDFLEKDILVAQQITYIFGIINTYIITRQHVEFKTFKQKQIQIATVISNVEQKDGLRKVINVQTYE
ncbi:Hypothetical_protein [Hexamita inflata]|uniref:Hypothetical_protein n=1 Tax=Hexamita inflata TaxID=28002 RepID=A0AA86QWL9_9EUKA|nr:Hypothetical protein HINF_LOCUS53158 [Hexamita inflata]